MNISVAKLLQPHTGSKILSFTLCCDVLCAKRNLPEMLITIIVTNKVALFNIYNLVRALVSPMTWK